MKNKESVIVIGLSVSLLAAGAIVTTHRLMNDDDNIKRKVFISSSGKPVEIITQESGEVRNTSIGKAIVIDILPDDAICPVIFESKESNNKKLPDVDIQWDMMRPERVPGSKKGNKWIWYVILKGDNCDKIASINGYIGSTLREFKSNPEKGRFLKTIGKCDGRDCVVSVDHPNAKKDDRIFMPVKLYGRNELSFNE